MATTNVYEVAARWKKAVQIAAHLNAHGILASEVGRIDPEFWGKLAARLQINLPSAETVTLAGEIMVVLETARRDALNAAAAKG